MATEAMEAKDQHTRPREGEQDAELLNEAHCLKRKKTVTWADGDEDEGDLDDYAGQEVAELPAAFMVEGIDVLFSDLKEAALRDQQAPSKSEEESFTTEKLYNRRVDMFTDLESRYKTEFWALADELLLRAWSTPATATTKDKTESKTRAQKNRSKYAEKAKDPEVVKALLQGGVHAAWGATCFEQEEADSLPSEENLSEFIVNLEKPEDEAAVEALRKRMVGQREAFLSQLSAIGRVEASATAAVMRELDRKGAVAALCGTKCRYFMRRAAVSIGRGTEAGVDIDLSSEGGNADVAKMVSRQQAELFLDDDGVFKVRCTGRRAMSVNGQLMKKGDVAEVPHLSLVRVGPIVLLFVVNKEALERIGKRSVSLNVS